MTLKVIGFADGENLVFRFQDTIGDISVVAQLDEMIRTSDVAERILSWLRVKAWRERCGGLNG